MPTMHAKLYSQRADLWVAKAGVHTVNIAAGCVTVTAPSGETVVEHKLDPKQLYRSADGGTIQFQDGSSDYILSFRDNSDVEAVVNAIAVYLTAQFKIGYGNLGYLAAMVEEAFGAPHVREAVVTGMGSGAFMELVEIFKKTEDIGDEKALTYLGRVAVGLFRLSAPDLVFSLLSEKSLPHVISMLERHPKRPTAPHRAQLHASSLQNPMHLPNELQMLLKHINMMMYLKETCLPLDMDDLSAEIVTKQVELTKGNAIQWMLGEPSRVVELCEKMAPKFPGYHSVVGLAVELVAETKTMPLDFRDNLLATLCKVGLMGVVREILLHDGEEEDDVKARQEVSTLIFAYTNFNVNLVRKEILSDPGLFTAFTERILHEPEHGFRSQWQDIVTVLLDTTISRGLGRIKSELSTEADFCTEFVAAAEEGMTRLLSPISMHSYQTTTVPHDAPHPKDVIFKSNPTAADTALTAAAPVIAYYLSQCEEGALWGTRHQVILQIYQLLCHRTTTPRTRLIPCVWILKGSLVSDTASPAIAMLDPFPHLLPHLSREGLAASAVLSFLQAILEHCATELVDLICEKYLKRIPNKAVREGYEDHHALREAQRMSTEEASPLGGLYD